MAQNRGNLLFVLLQVLLSFHLLPVSWGISKVNDTTFSADSTDSGFVNFTKYISSRIHRPKLPYCTCGVKPHQDVKIVGGTLSKQHCWPWVAAIVYTGAGGNRKNLRKKVVCGASVVGHRHLLTAAHCVEYILDEGISNFRAVLGTNDLNDEEAVIVPLSHAVSHPKFDEDQVLDYDVGVITLETAVQFSQSILPICLTPQKGVPFNDRNAIVAGWGSTYFGGATTTMQMQVMIGVISNSECQALYSNETHITSTMLCARRLNKDSCQGDSGGPLFLLQEGYNDRYLQVGIVSFGKGCGDKRYPGIYSRVSRFTKWIMRRIGSDGECALSGTKRIRESSSSNKINRN